MPESNHIAQEVLHLRSQHPQGAVANEYPPGATLRTLPASAFAQIDYRLTNGAVWTKMPPSWYAGKTVNELLRKQKGIQIKVRP